MLQRLAEIDQRTARNGADPSQLAVGGDTTSANIGTMTVGQNLAGTLTVSFTASTTVPVSHAGVKAEARTIAELTPAGCSSLAPTTLLVGSGTFQITTSHTLVLGSSGVDTITEMPAAGSNCVVGGGGKDKVTVAASDICIIGPATGTNYKGCTTSA